MTDRPGTSAEIDELDELRANRALTKYNKKSQFTELADRLLNHPTFADCTRDDMVALLCAGKPTAIPAQWAFVQENTPADAAYVLLEGRARVFRNGVPIADVETGDVVGETALLNGTLRNATVTSIAPLKALRIDRRRFEELLWRRPNVRDALNQVASARLAAS
jgi:CRP/FNR family cyclic AMP-dependent transcriptional regulator